MRKCGPLIKETSEGPRDETKVLWFQPQREEGRKLEGEDRTEKRKNLTGADQKGEGRDANRSSRAHRTKRGANSERGGKRSWKGRC